MTKTEASLLDELHRSGRAVLVSKSQKKAGRNLFLQCMTIQWEDADPNAKYGVDQTFDKLTLGPISIHYGG